MSRIAIIDDVKICRLPTRHVLTEAGHHVDEPEPTCVFDLMVFLRQNQPDLLITDLEMPGCSGVTLIRMIREDPVLADLPILVISVHRDDAISAGLNRLSVQGFLYKPVGAAHVLQEVTAILEWVALAHLPKVAEGSPPA